MNWCGLCWCPYPYVSRAADPGPSLRFAQTATLIETEDPAPQFSFPSPTTTFLIIDQTKSVRVR